MPTIRTLSYSFTISDPFQPGTVITKAEAQALNALRAENLQNSARKLVAREQAKVGPDQLLAPETLAEIQAQITQLDHQYQFQERSEARRLSDLEAEAEALARERVDAELQRHGEQIHPEDLGYQQLVATTASLPAIQFEARERLQAKRAALAQTLADL